MEKKLSFLHAGTFGDTIYGLNIIKILGGGDLYIKYKGVDEAAWAAFGGFLNAELHTGRYTEKDLEFLFPLLEKQSYINKLRVWNNEPVDHDLFIQKIIGGPDSWRLGNHTECYALMCDVDIHVYRKQLLIDPWLDPVEPIKIPGRPIVINRTSRHLYNCEPRNSQWVKWISEGLSDVAIFIGHEKECEDFNRLFNTNVPYMPVTDMLEMARIIQGSEQFIGNLSVSLSLAIGLGKTFWCETRRDWDNIRTPRGWGDVWFPRVNGHYF